MGSTTEKTLAHRLAKHKESYQSYLKGKCRFTTSFDIFKNENYEIVLIEDYPCNSKDALHYIEINKCVNKVMHTRTVKEYYQQNKYLFNEYQKQYYQQNKERAKEYRKQHYQTNKASINERMKEYRKQYYQNKKLKSIVNEIQEISNTEDKFSFTIWLLYVLHE